MVRSHRDRAPWPGRRDDPAAAAIVLVIRKLMDGSSGPVTAATAALLQARGSAAWGDVVTFISSLSGVDPATLRSLDLGTPPAAPS